MVTAANRDTADSRQSLVNDCTEPRADMSRLLTVRTQQKGRCHCPERHAALQLGKLRLVKFA